MKTRRPARRDRSVWERIAGYGGTVLLVAAAVAVLLVPMLDDGGGADPAAAQGAATGGARTPSAAPTRHTAPPSTVRPPRTTAPGAGDARGGTPEGAGAGDGGPQPPGERGGGTGASWCPQGTAFYRAADTGVDVVVAVASSGVIRAELEPQGRSPLSQQTTIRGGSPHTFRFTGVAPRQVKRVKVTTMSVGAAMQSCYARASN